MQQYASNVGQLLETALGRVENAKPFNEAGGDELLLDLIQVAVPGPRPLLARASCCWGHSSQVWLCGWVGLGGMVLSCVG